MGKIVGWADNPVDANENQTSTTNNNVPVQQPEPAVNTTEGPESTGQNTAIPSAGLQTPVNAAGATPTAPANAEVASPGFSAEDNLVPQPASESVPPVASLIPQGESLEKQPYTLEIANNILGMKLYYSEEHHVCDISQFDVHRIEFLINHAIKHEDLDLFALVQAAFCVKEQLSLPQYGGWPDTLESPNLDSLIELLEEKYFAAE